MHDQCLKTTHPASVRIGLIRVNALVLDDIREGVGHKATPAAMVTIFSGAVHQVLRAEGQQGTRGLLQLTFQSTDRAEGPTRATRTLQQS